jgi:nicotinamidase-related amidase
MKLRVPLKMLSGPTPAFSVSGADAAVLIMDVQDFTSRKDAGLGKLAAARGILREFDEYYEQVEAAIRNLRRLLDASREHRLPVLYTLLHAERSDRTDLSTQLRVAGWPVPTGDPLDEIRPEVSPLAGDIVLPRGTYGAFAGTDLLSILEKSQVRTLILAGMLANTTVALTAQEAADRGFGVILVWDASASETLDWHDNVKTRLVGPLIRMRTAKQVIEMMKGART